MNNMRCRIWHCRWVEIEILGACCVVATCSLSMKSRQRATCYKGVCLCCCERRLLLCSALLIVANLKIQGVRHLFVVVEAEEAVRGSYFESALCHWYAYAYDGWIYQLEEVLSILNCLCQILQCSLTLKLIYQGDCGLWNFHDCILIQFERKAAWHCEHSCKVISVAHTMVIII